MKQLVEGKVACIGEVISLAEGIAFSADYRSMYPDRVGSYTIGREILLAILAQVGCTGLRLYHGMEEPGKQTLVYLAVNADCRLLGPSTRIGENGELMKVLPIVGERSKPGGGGLQEDVNEGWGIPEKNGCLQAGEEISYEEGIQMVKDHMCSEFAAAIMNYTVGWHLLMGILSQPGCAGMRFYNALEQGMQTLVYVGVCSDGRLLGPAMLVGNKIKAGGGGLDVEIAEDWGIF